MNIPDKETASKLLKKWVSEGDPNFYRFLSRLDDKESEIVRRKVKKDITYSLQKRKTTAKVLFRNS